MSKQVRAAFNVATQFFSDSHLFHPDNGGAYKHLQKLYASRAEKIYLVGDMSDFEHIEDSLKKEKGLTLEQFPTDFKEVLELLQIDDVETHLRLYDALSYQASLGKEVIFMGGNHDEGINRLKGRNINGIQIEEEALYDAGQNGRYHIEHGQNFDVWFGKDYSDWVSYNACRALDGALKIDAKAAKKFAVMKDAYILTNVMKGVAKTVGVVKPFKNNALAKAFKEGVDGVICGHIHKAANTQEQYEGRSIQYINTGDGLTHGTSWVHTKEGDWAKIKRKHLPEDSKAIFEPVNPLEAHRARSWEFLQAGWKAQLAYLHDKAQAKATLKDPAFDAVPA